MTNPASEAVATLNIHRALRFPITGNTAYIGVVLPAEPPIDKVFAAMLVANRNSVSLQTIEFWANTRATPEQFRMWRGAGIYPIDLDDFKYHEAGVKSASEFVAVHLSMMTMTAEGMVSNLTPGVQKLMDMINKNNGSGYLRGMKFSIPYIIREAYKLKADDAFHADLVSKAIDVLESFAAVENGTIARSVENLEEALPDLVDMLRKSMDQPLTLGRYLRDRWVLGDEPGDIRTKVGFWLDQFNAVEKRVAEAEKTLSGLQTRKWSVAGFAGVVLKSDDHFILKAATRSRQWGVRIVVTGPGHTTISTNGLDLSKVNEVLQRLEPGKWYYQAQMGALINGGPQYTAVEPTGLSTEHLIQMLQGKVQPKAKK